MAKCCLLLCFMFIFCVDLLYGQYRQCVRDPVITCLTIEQDLLRMKGRVGIQTVESVWSRGDLALVIERYHCCVCWLQSWATKTQTKTNLELYLEYLKCYDLGHYLDQSLTFRLVVETVGDLLYTQRDHGLGQGSCMVQPFGSSYAAYFSKS
jgi:hypothetical protein